MNRLYKRLILGVGFAAMSAAIACSSGSGSPMSPSESGVSGGGTTIRGTTHVVSAAASASQLASHAQTTIRVCVSGTLTCADVDGAGNFELRGNFSGDVQLEFTGPQVNVRLVIPDVRPGETIVITVELDGTTGVVRIEFRHGDDDDDSADDDESVDDDDSADDDSSDDESEDDDSSDDDSKDDDSKD